MNDAIPRGGAYFDRSDTIAVWTGCFVHSIPSRLLNRVPGYCGVGDKRNVRLESGAVQS